MAEEISVRFANAKKEYLKTLSPISYTSNIAEAYKVYTVFYFCCDFRNQ